MKRKFITVNEIDRSKQGEFNDEPSKTDESQYVPLLTLLKRVQRGEIKLDSNVQFDSDSEKLDINKAVNSYKDEVSLVSEVVEGLNAMSSQKYAEEQVISDNVTLEQPKSEDLVKAEANAVIDESSIT